MAEWRVGRKLGVTLYRDEVFVGHVCSAIVAAEIVETMNRVGRLLDEVRPVDRRRRRAAESGRERSLWSDPVYADRCTTCDHPAFMHHGNRCLGDFMSCTCATPEPPDAERRSEATPQKDLLGPSRVDPYDTTKGGVVEPCAKCGLTSCTDDRQEPAF